LSPAVAIAAVLTDQDKADALRVRVQWSAFLATRPGRGRVIPRSRQCDTRLRAVRRYLNGVKSENHHESPFSSAAFGRPEMASRCESLGALSRRAGVAPSKNMPSSQRTRSSRISY